MYGYNNYFILEVYIFHFKQHDLTFILCKCGEFNDHCELHSCSFILMIVCISNSNSDSNVLLNSRGGEIWLNESIYE